MSRTIVRTGMVTASLALAVTAALATPAVADQKPVIPSSPPTTAVPGGYANWADLYAAQATLDTAAAAIAAADEAGAASIVVSAEQHQVKVYWPGAVPASVRDAASATGVAVSFVPARFSHTELVNEAKKLASSPGIASIAPKADGSGLAVTVENAAGGDGLGARTRVPLSISVGNRVQAMADRQADTPRFWGGSRYNSPIGGCSNGFALRHPDGDFYSVTAAHCGTVPEYASDITIPGQPSPTGFSFAKLPCRDTMAIGYPNGVAPLIYTGPFNSGTSAHVAGATPDFVGDLIATGGASSGEHVNVPVLAVDVFIPIGGINCQVVGPLTQAGLQGNQCVVAPGDSGGPAYSRLTAKDILGRGTITAGNLGSATCPGVVPNGANTVYYAPLLRPAGDPEVGSLQFGGVDILT